MGKELGEAIFSTDRKLLMMPKLSVSFELGQARIDPGDSNKAIGEVICLVELPDPSQCVVLYNLGPFPLEGRNAGNK